MSSDFRNLDEIVDDVLETLHERSNICVGADTCEARGAIEPLVEFIREMQISLGAERSLKRDLEMKLSEADLLADKWLRSQYADTRMMGADLKQVLGG